MKVAYRQALEDDAIGIHLVETHCFNTPWSFESILYEMCENDIAVYVVAEVDHQIIGFAGLHEIFNEGHITNVAVLPEFRGRRIGEKLLNKLFSIVKNTVDQYTLEVRVSNKAAITLYSRLGFKPAGVRPKYYTDTHEDALIMWRYDAGLSV